MQRRNQNYGELRKPLDPTVFIHDLRSEMTTALQELNTAATAMQTANPCITARICHLHMHAIGCWG
jgi:hypothetical protein